VTVKSGSTNSSVRRGRASYTLARVLDDPEGEDFIDNRKEFESPVASYYAMGEKGDDLCPIFESLDTWGDYWL